MKKSVLGVNVRNIVLLLVIVLVFISTSGCKKDEKYYIENLNKLEKKKYPAEEAEVKGIEELKEGIKKYEREINKKVKASQQIGIYYKMLAVRYINAKMYGKALESLKEAIKYYPENEILFYLAGVSAARMSKAMIGEKAEKEKFLKLAENYYKRAIELEPYYRDALFGLAVLYVFEEKKPEAAIPLLNKLLEKEKFDTDGMFLLARAYYEAGEYESAIDMYEKIIKTTRSNRRRDEARKNIDEIKAEMYEK